MTSWSADDERNRGEGRRGEGGEGKGREGGGEEGGVLASAFVRSGIQD